MGSLLEQMLVHNWHWIALVVFAGALLQGLSGVGLGMVASPLLALLDPALVPGPLLMISCVIAVMSVLRERAALDVSGLGYALAGRLAASIPAALLIGLLPVRGLAITFALVILLAVLASLLKLPLRPTRLNLAIAGTLSGFMGTLTSVGLPPMALVYQSVPPAQLRASIGGFLAVGSLISVAALASVGRFGLPEIGMGLLLLAPLFAGFAVSGRLRHRLPALHMRLVVLSIAAASAALLLLRQLTG